MKYICEIDVAHEDGDIGEHWYCGRDCGPLLTKEDKRGEYPYCAIFNTRLELEEMPYELPAVLRCANCRGAFYPAPLEEAR